MPDESNANVLSDLDNVLIDNDPKFIRKSSYTALRLYNEVPSQIDQETRILFVGPIPIEWLLANKKSWGSWGKMRRMFPKVYSRLWSDSGAETTAADGRVVDDHNGMGPVIPTDTARTDTDDISRTPVVAGPEGVIRAINDLVLAPRVDEGADNESGSSFPNREEFQEEPEIFSPDEDDLYPDPSGTNDLVLSRYLTTEEANSTLQTLPVVGDEYPYESTSNTPSPNQSPNIPDDKPNDVTSISSINASATGGGIISDGESRASPSPRSTSHLLGNESHAAGDYESHATSDFDAISYSSKKSDPTPIYGPAGSSSHSNRTPFFNIMDASVSTMNSMQSYFTARESVGSIGSRANLSDESIGSNFPINELEVQRLPNHSASIQSNDDSSNNESSASTIRLNKSPPLPPQQSHKRASTIDTVIPVNTSTATTNPIVSPDAKSYLAEILERDMATKNKKKETISNQHNPKRVNRTSSTVTTGTTGSKLADTIMKAKTNSRKVKREYRKRKQSFIISTDRLLKRKKKGEVVMIEKLLVMIKAAPKDRIMPQDFNEMEQVDTRIVQRWREYVVVARKSGKPDTPIFLQFYKSRHIAKMESGDPQQDHGSSNITPELSVGIGESFNINLYSSLDKSIVLWNQQMPGNEEKNKKDNLIYILRARSDPSAMNWLSFLSSIVGITAESLITVRVPDLGVSIEVEVPFQDLDLIRRFEDQSQLVSLRQLTKHSAAPSWLGSFIVEKCLDAMYEVESIREQIDRNWRGTVKAGLVWRRYDRLEWMFDLRGSQIQSSWAMMKTHHELELRPKVPFSLPVMIKGSDTPLAEPFPIEGFVTRLTTWKGDVRKQKLLNRSYFHSHDNLLFYSLPVKALPPYVGGGGSNHNSISAIMAGIPLVCEVAPYRTDKNGHIEWLDHVQNVAEFDQFDLMAQFEMKRRIASISRSDGFIDLIELKNIRPCSEKSNRFEVIFKTGTVLKFQVHDEQTRDVWVRQLHDLMIYWKYRRREEINRTNAIRQQNLEILHIDEDAEAFVGEAASKWETDRGVADPLTYNIAGIACSRSLYMKGILFQKPTKFSTFRKYYVVLTLTDLILYIPSPSSVYWTGGFCLADDPKDLPNRVNFYRVQSVALSECYVYSGPLTSCDLLNRDKTFNKDNPGRHALPRAYADGWKSAEEESLRCFVLWFGKKSYAATNRKDKKISIKTVNRLGVGGTSMVFMARSRHDRDLWVTALNTVMSRLVVDSHEDIIIT